MDVTAQNSSSRKLHKKHKHEKKDIEYGNMRTQKKKKQHGNKDKNLNENSVLSKHCHKTDSGTDDKHRRRKENEEELSSPSEHKKHKKKKHKRKEKENDIIEDGNKMKKLVESRVLSKKCHRTDSSGDEQSGRKESEILSSKSKHKKHKKKRMQSEDHLLTEECKKRRIRQSNDLTSADDTCLTAAEHSGISVGYKKKRKHRVEDNDCDNLSWLRHRVGFSENSQNSSLSSDLSTADNRVYSDSSGAIVGVSESEQRKRKTHSPAKNENPRKKHKHKHKKDLVGKVEDQSYTCSENSVADEDLRHQEHLKTAAISIKSVSTERIENKIAAVRNSKSLSQKRKQTAKSSPGKSDKYICSELKRVKSVLENLNSKKTSNDDSKKRRVQEAGDADKTQSMSEVAAVSRAGENEAARGDQGAEVRRHWRRNVPTLTMEESVAMLGREMRSTSEPAYWNVIRALLEERKISYRTGLWTKREDEILSRNWEALLKEVNLEAHEIIYATRTENFSSTRKMIKDKKFYLRLTEGLNRTSDSVYQRARRIFDKKHQGLMHLLTEEEKLELDSLFQQFGKKWRKISEEMGYSQQSIVNYFHNLELRQVNSAPFSEDEDEAIVEWVRHVTGQQDVSKVYRLPWVQILSQESILTQNKRTSEQCRKRWLGGLCWKLANPGKTRRKFSAEDQAKLIRLIYESDAMEDNDIDFANLMQEFEHVPSPQKMKGIWHKISFIVPDYQWKQFTDIIEYLNDVYLPRLEYNHNLIPIIDDWSDED